MTIATLHLPDQGHDDKPAARAGWLSLAAAPTFLLMAGLTAIQGAGMPGMLCLAGQETPLLTGMAPMYLLMSAFHLAPWLKRFSRWRMS